jgi:hypothetical protein
VGSPCQRPRGRESGGGKAAHGAEGELDRGAAHGGKEGERVVSSGCAARKRREERKPEGEGRVGWRGPCGKREGEGRAGPG